MVDQSGEALVDIIVGDAGQRPIGLYNLVKGSPHSTSSRLESWSTEHPNRSSPAFPRRKRRG
jgi:hypothetical protein